MLAFIDWLQSLEWSRLIPEVIGKGLGFFLGFAVSWYLLFRKKVHEIDRFEKGESDEVLFQTHQLAPVAGTDEVVLVFRNVGPRTTVFELYDNVGARELVRTLADKTTLMDPLLDTGGGRTGFEVVNIALGFVAGEMSTSPFDRENWLFAMTCEDRQVVRKKCVRCFLIRPQDLERFLDWNWCKTKVRVEKPWHAFRIAALHRIAQFWKREQAYFKKHAADRLANLEMPAVDEQTRHERVRIVSLGVYPNEPVVGEPLPIDWDIFEDRLKELGLEVEE